MLFDNAVIGTDENISVPLLTFPKMFERQAARTPGLPAVRHDDATVRPGELEATAHLFTTLVAGPEHAVTESVAEVEQGRFIGTAPPTPIEHREAPRMGRGVLVPMLPGGKR